MRRPRTPTPFQRVILGLVLGILVGLFVGEPAGSLALVGDAYIRLLQMTVLPYILVSLTAGLGGLDAAMARRIGVRGGGMILVLWGVTLLTLLCLPFAYPDWTSAASFSTSMINEAEPFDPLALYLPANPFYSFGHGIVPAVVFFCISLGLALIAVDDKEGLLRGMRNISDALMKIASYVGKIAPIGIFAISAAAAGTLRVEELSRLQVFLWVYLLAWSVLTLWTLPALVAWATPFTYREVLRESRTPMVTAFATGTVLVVLPMIAERCKAIIEERSLDGPETETTVDVLVPTAYSFPSAGTLLGLGFILFAAWYVGTPLSPAQYPGYASVGAFVAFGSMAVAIPFMLDFFSLSADLFQLYLLGSVVTARFATALAAMHGVVVCLLGVTAVLGLLKLRSMFQAVAISMAVTGIAMVALGYTLTRAIPYAYTGEEAFVTKSLLVERAPTRQVELPDALEDPAIAEPRLDVIRERGSLRVGYLADRLPFAYRSATGDVVGFDLDILHRLARDLNVSLDIVRLDWKSATKGLEEGRIDVLAGGIGITPQRATQVTFSRSYFDQTLAFIVVDRMRDEWVSMESIRKLGPIRVALPNIPHYEEKIRRLLPQVEVVTVDSPRDYLRNTVPDVDAMASSAEGGSAWTLIYPDFSVVVPKGLRVRGSTGFGIPRRQGEMKRYLDTWLELADKNGLSESLYDYWILGRDETRRIPRWSFMKNVLGWGSADTPAEATQSQ